MLALLRSLCFCSASVGGSGEGEREGGFGGMMPCLRRASWLFAVHRYARQLDCEYLSRARMSTHNSVSSLGLTSACILAVVLGDDKLRLFPWASSEAQ